MGNWNLKKFWISAAHKLCFIENEVYHGVEDCFVDFETYGEFLDSLG